MVVREVNLPRWGMAAMNGCLSFWKETDSLSRCNSKQLPPYEAIQGTSASTNNPMSGPSMFPSLVMSAAQVSRSVASAESSDGETNPATSRSAFRVSSPSMSPLWQAVKLKLAEVVAMVAALTRDDCGAVLRHSTEPLLAADTTFVAF